MGQLEGCQKIPKKILRSDGRCFSDPADTIEKSCLSFTVWPHERSTFEEKKVTWKGHFPRPAETDPYVHTNYKSFTATTDVLLVSDSAKTTERSSHLVYLFWEAKGSTIIHTICDHKEPSESSSFSFRECVADALLLLLEESLGSVDHLVEALAGILGLAVAQHQHPLDAHLRMRTCGLWTFEHVQTVKLTRELET